MWNGSTVAQGHAWNESVAVPGLGENRCDSCMVCAFPPVNYRACFSPLCHEAVAALRGRMLSYLVAVTLGLMTSKQDHIGVCV